MEVLSFPMVPLFEESSVEYPAQSTRQLLERRFSKSLLRSLRFLPRPSRFAEKGLTKLKKCDTFLPNIKPTLKGGGREEVGLTRPQTPKPGGV